MTKKRLGTVLTIMLLIAVIRYCLAAPPLTPAQLQIELAQLNIVDDIRDEIEFLRTYEYKGNDEEEYNLQMVISVLRIALSPLTFTGRLVVFAFRVIGFMPLSSSAASAP